MDFPLPPISAHLQPRSRQAPLPPRLLRHHLRAPLANGQHCKHRVHGRHFREDARIRNTDMLKPPQSQFTVHDRHLVSRQIAHLGRAGGMVDCVRDIAGVGADVGVGLDVRAGGDFAFEPGGEGGLLGHGAGGADAGDQGGGVIAGGVGEVLEVEGWFDGRVGGGEVEAAFAFGPGDVGRHAEGVDGGVVAEAAGVKAEGDLIAVHHHVGDAGGVPGAGEEDAGVGVHGCLVRGDGLVEFPHYDALGVVEEIVANAGDGGDNGNVEGS